MRQLVAKNVKRCRLAAGLTQNEVAVKMGVDRAYVSGLEMGKRNPTVITLWQISQALDVRPVDLLSEDA
ncbi:helix-turn-helix domain-containing protein [Mesorhizobium shangrilense]|uniref:Helix-turn-helix transcriptional regulator n=1 Tax=Mesorhizobium shangrilense TaxID=460060 RepID=A0ABV2D753_9HYPH